MNKVWERFENSRFTLTLRRFFNSWAFPVFAAALILVLYYLNLDIVSYWCICVCGLAILFTCKDATPFLFLLLFLNLPISYKNTPSIFNPDPTDYYSRTGNVAQLITIVAILVTGLLVRTAISIVKRRFKVTPVLWGLIAVAVAFIMNGVLANNYDPINLMYGCALAAIYLGIFVFCCGNINMDDKTIKKIAYYFIVLFVVLSIELGIRYLLGGTIVDENGVKHRGVLFFGWGTYNNMGVLIVMSIPAWFYFACKNSRYGWAFLLGGAANLVIAYLTNSRQAQLMGSIIFAACCVVDIIAVKDKNLRIQHSCIIGSMIFAGAVVCALFYKDISGFVVSVFKGTETGSGRLPLWKEGFFNNFLHKPVFGTGFYGADLSNWDKGGSGLDMIPRFYHNTVIQLLASCGIVGFVAFAAHRVQTVISLFKNFCFDRIFIALTMCGIMFCGLLDVHMFSPFSALIYAMLVPVLAGTEKMKAVEATEEVKAGALAGALKLSAVTMSEEEDKLRRTAVYQRVAHNNKTEVTMEEERNLTIKDIIMMIGRHIKGVIVVTLAGLLAFTAVIWLWYNRNHKNYSVSYELVYPNSEKGTYPDGTYIVASEAISKETLTGIKNGVYSSEENAKEFSDINVNEMSKGGGIKIVVDVVSNSDGTVSRTYKLTAKSKYFDDDSQAEKFLTAVANYPVRKIMSVIEDDRYGYYLTVFDSATTYEAKIKALEDQKNLLLEEYGNVKVMGGSVVIENLARVTNIFNDEQVKELNHKIENKCYKWDTESYRSSYEARSKTIDREIEDNETIIEIFEGLRQKMFDAGNTTEVAAYDNTINEYGKKNAALKIEKMGIEKTFTEIKLYTDETTTEYEEKQDFDNQLNSYYDTLQSETQLLKDNLSQIYTKNTRVVYVSNFRTSGGINLILAAAIGAVAGFIIAAIAVCIAYGEKFKAEKYACVDGVDAQPEVKADETKAASAEEAAAEDEGLITVSGVIGDGVEGESGAIHQEDNLQELVAAEILAEETAAADGDKTDEMSADSVEEVKAVEETKPAEEQKKAEKKPAAKKSTASKTAANTAAKKTPAKSAAKPAAKTEAKPAAKTAAKPAAKKPAAKKD